MAKLDYSAPFFKFCPIPLTAAGTGGGCAIPTNSAKYICKVEDPFTGAVLFNDYDINGCLRIPASGTVTPDSPCYHIPMADFNIYSS